MIRRGEEWGTPAGGPPDLEVLGDDPALATAVGRVRASLAAPRVRFDAAPTSDLARAVGLVGPGAATTEVPLDVITVAGTLDGGVPDDPAEAAVAVNAVVLGPAPDRLRWWHRRRPTSVVVDGRVVFDGPATTVLVANGQFLRGHDVAPAGHPGDGRLEVQVYALDPGERARMRRRLADATHVPHPRIATSSGKSLLVERAPSGPLEVDGAARGRRGRLRAEVLPEAYRLLV